MTRGHMLRAATILAALAARAGAQPAAIPADSLQRIVAQRVAAGRTPGLIVGVIDSAGGRRIVAPRGTRLTRRTPSRSVIRSA